MLHGDLKGMGVYGRTNASQNATRTKGKGKSTSTTFDGRCNGRGVLGSQHSHRANFGCGPEKGKGKGKSWNAAVVVGGDLVLGCSAIEDSSMIKVSIAIDSGAKINVLPIKYAKTSNQEVSDGQHYVAASGCRTPHLGGLGDSA